VYVAGADDPRSPGRRLGYGIEVRCRKTSPLTIDSGWREVAQTALDFVKRFV
jgi:hypothetical protein